jgi:citronellyl-CoA synthetase
MMGIIDAVRTIAEMPTLLSLRKGLTPRPLEERDCLGAVVERTAARLPDRPAILFENRTVTWGDLNAEANRFAAAFRKAGLERGDTASVFMENRVEFVTTIVALNKIGVTASLINTNLRGRPLTHCVSITGSKKCIFGEELAHALGDVKGDLSLSEDSDFIWVPDQNGLRPANWALDLAALSADADTADPPDTGENTLGESAFYIFTSGTTGLPKAAVLSNRRYLMTGLLAHKAGLRCSENDRLYLCLPLYHGTGLMVGMGAAFSSGASVFLRRKFSASNFLRETREHGTTCFVYIGELCRYLVNTPPKPDDHDNPVTRVMGNGLRPDVWMTFKNRFGIKRVTEFYGASEGNVAFANLFNKDRTIGTTSVRHAVVRYDIEHDEIVRDANGRCIEVEPGEPGLLLGHINEQAVFEGYTSKEATEAKIVRDAFEDGDAWFNSGDLIRQVDVGFSLGYPHYQFVDRVGDTFRWKSENVSTNEVGEILNGFPQIRLSNVYGVQIPGADGRAGMAAVTLEEGAAELDLEALSEYVNRELPSYARPIFIRVEPETDVTGTFKLIKNRLRDEAYDPDRVRDPLYVMKPGSDRYEPLDSYYYKIIARGEAGY